MDLDVVRREFENKTHIYKQLEAEIVFILEPAISEANIKLHSITHRVKNIDSFLHKAQRKESQKPFDNIRDIVGIRVICLFLSDIESIGNVIRESFNVLEEDDKVEGADVSSFAYMSVHYIAMMKAGHSGPRYDPIANLPFEIQVRTIAMDAWANVSHYLSYKSDEDVPSELRRDFYALSGLFYVADRHFEMFYGSRKQSQEKMTEFFAEASSEAKAQQEINLDSLSAYLYKGFPKRTHASLDSVSDLVKELINAGYKTIGEIQQLIEMASPAFHLYEKANRPSARGYTDVGVVRISLDIVDDNFIRTSTLLHKAGLDTDDNIEAMIQDQIRHYAKYRRILGNKGVTQ